MSLKLNEVEFHKNGMWIVNSHAGNQENYFKHDTERQKWEKLERKWEISLKFSFVTLLKRGFFSLFIFFMSIFIKHFFGLFKTKAFKCQTFWSHLLLRTVFGKWTKSVKGCLMCSEQLCLKNRSSIPWDVFYALLLFSFFFSAVTLLLNSLFKFFL